MSQDYRKRRRNKGLNTTGKPGSINRRISNAREKEALIQN
jgi:hypothetical protein